MVLSFGVLTSCPPLLHLFRQCSTVSTSGYEIEAKAQTVSIPHKRTKSRRACKSCNEFSTGVPLNAMRRDLCLRTLPTILPQHFRTASLLFSVLIERIVVLRSLRARACADSPHGDGLSRGRILERLRLVHHHHKPTSPCLTISATTKKYAHMLTGNQR